MRGIVFYAKDGHKLDYQKRLLNFREELDHAVEYAKQAKIPISVLTDENTIINNSNLDHVLRVSDSEINNNTGFGIKAFIYSKTPYETTLLLDTDALIVDQNLEFGFAMAESHGISLCIDNHYHLPSYHHAKYTLEEMGAVQDYLIQYNGGVIFLNKSKHWESMFLEWQNLVSKNDFIPQVALSALLFQMKLNPFVLTDAWNYQPHYKTTNQCGPVKIWHSREVSPNEESTLFYNRRPKSRDDILV